MGSHRPILPPLCPYILSVFSCHANTNSFQIKSMWEAYLYYVIIAPPQLKARYSASHRQGLHILVPLVCHSVIVLTLLRWIDLYTA